MSRPRKGARVCGPYHQKSRNRWRVDQYDESGTKTTHYANTLRRANLLAKACRLDLDLDPELPPTIKEVAADFINMKLVAMAWGARTEERARGDLSFFWGSHGDLPISRVDVSFMRDYLIRLRDNYALASQKSRWCQVAEFLSFAVVRGHLKKSPLVEIGKAELAWRSKRGSKKMGRGKTQLRNVTEATLYLQAASQLNKPEQRVASQLPLLTGLRSGEVRHLQVGDCDFVLGKLWIRDDEVDNDDGWNVKSASSRRTVDIPARLVDDLMLLCDGQRPDDFVFRSSWSTSGGAFDRKWLNRMVGEVCRTAGTKRVTAHGLRDTFASIVTELGKRSIDDVGLMLGHADKGQTAKRHYIGAPTHQPALDLPQQRFLRLVASK